MPSYPQPGAYGQQAGNAIQGAQAAGFFSPMGSPAIMANVRRNAPRTGDNARRRNAILSRLMGLDPNQSRVAAVNADTEASGNTADALNQAQYGQLLGNQNYFRSLFGGQLGNEQQLQQMRYQHDLNQPTVGGMIGGLVGQGAGALLGGYGASLGAGRPRQPQQQQQQQSPNYTQYDYQSPYG